MQFQGFIVDSEFPPRDGGTARVYKAFKKGDAFALKVYESERILQLSLRETIFRKEVAVLQALRHPNIVEFLDAGYSEDLNAYCVALEWLPTNLGQHLAAMDGGGDPPRWWDTFAPRFAVPLLEALTVVHAAGFTHRDLKPSNFLVTADGVPKLADFGIASIIAGDHTVAGFSTPRFAPPEGSKDFRSDLYSMGLSLLDLVSGGLVLGGDHRDQSIEDALYEADLRQDAEQFIRSLVEREPERRFQTAGQAASRLRNLIEARHSVDAPQGLVLEVGIPGPLRFSVLLTHLHWDHCLALPFFAPLYDRANRFDFYGASVGHMDIEEAIDRVMRPPWFPVNFRSTPASKRFHHITPDDRFTIGDLSVRAVPLHHPDGVMGYRIEWEEATLVIATDVEHGVLESDARLAELAVGADVLIYDAQYLPDEYLAHKVGWGHSTWEAGVAVAEAAGVGTLILTSHDPSRDDDAIDALLEDARSVFPRTEAAREGETVWVGSRADGS